MSLDIIRMENVRMLKKRIRQVESLIDDFELREQAVLDTLEESLVHHGKPARLINQIVSVSTFLAQKIGKSERYCARLSEACRVYDIGNIVIDSEVYEKDSELTYEEFSVVKNHTRIGFNLLSSLGYISTDMAAIISVEHHEWWNGGGYPYQLKFDQINIAARIVSLAESLCTMQWPRPGRRIWDYTKVLEYIDMRKAIEFDPDLVKTLLMHAQEIHALFGQESRQKII